MATYGDLGPFLSVLSVTGLVLYFVTSSDSGSLVIDCLSANGHPDPPTLQRIFWALSEGATATALLVAGGKNALQALQAASIASGLPLTFLLNFVCLSLWRALRVDSGEIDEDEGKWKMSVFDSFSSLKRLGKVLISLLFPWYYMGYVAKGTNRRQKTRLIVSALSAVAFYLWIALLCSESAVRSISYVGWAVLLGFLTYMSSLRGSIRIQFDLQGNMIEDFFVCLLIYPLALVQMMEQISDEPLTDGIAMKEIDSKKPEEQEITEAENGRV